MQAELNLGQVVLISSYFHAAQGLEQEANRIRKRAQSAFSHVKSC